MISQNSDVKTVSENFMREVREHPEKDYFDKRELKIEEAEEELENLKEKIRILTKKPAGVF